MKRILPFYVLLAVTFVLLQWYMGKQAKPPVPPAPAPIPQTVPLPSGLQTSFAKEHFEAALQQLAIAAKMPTDERNKYYNNAVKELQKTQGSNEAGPQKTSPDRLAAEFEVAYVQWHDLKQSPTAASAYNTIITEPIPPGAAAPVFDGKTWKVLPVKSFANAQYTQVVRTIHVANHNNISYQFINVFVKACSFAGPYKDATALIILGVLISILLTPVRNWQYRSMGKMSKLQPEMKKIQTQYKGQPEEINKRTMELYKAHGTNPAMGCLPMVVQIPFMWWLYYAIRLYQFELTGKFLWVGSHFAATHTAWTTPNGPIFATSLAHLDIPLLLLYTASMYFYSKLMPVTGTDPAQAKQSQNMSSMMSLMMPFMFYFYNWPAAFMLWWLAMNVTQILITIFYLRKHPDLQPLFNPTKAATASEPAMAKSGASTNGRAFDQAAPTPAQSENGTSKPENGGSTNGHGPRRIAPKNRRKPRF